MTYRARLAPLDEARRLLLPLSSAHVARDADRLRWFRDDAELLVLEQGDGSASVVGGAGIGARAWVHRRRPLRAALFADLSVDASPPRVFSALMLAGSLRSHVDATFDVGYGIPDDRALPVYRRAGYRELGPMTRYVRVLRTGPYLDRYAPQLSLARGTAAVVDRALRGLSWLAHRSLRGAATLRWLTEVDAQFDALWLESRDTFPVVADRTAASLRARLRSGRYRVAGVFAGDVLRAYAVVRDSAGVADIVDMFGPSPTEIDALLRCLVTDLVCRGYHGVTFFLLGAPQLPPLLAAHGFVARARGTRTVALTLNDAARPELAELRDPALWYLTELDAEA